MPNKTTLSGSIKCLFAWYHLEIQVSLVVYFYVYSEVLELFLLHWSFLWLPSQNYFSGLLHQMFFPEEYN